jgi:hypothetical protein
MSCQDKMCVISSVVSVAGRPDFLRSVHKAR